MEKMQNIEMIPYYVPPQDIKSKRDKYIDKMKDEANKRIDKEDVKAPKLFFTWYIVSPRFSGKSNLLVHLLVKCYKDIFDKIVLFCSTFEDQPLYKMLGILPENTYYNYDDAVLMKLVKEQEENDEPDKILVVFDDVLEKPAGFLSEFPRLNRHKCISLLYISQTLRHLTPKMRANASAVTVFNSIADEELDKFEFTDEFIRKFMEMRKLVKGTQYERNHFITYNMGNGKNEYHVNLKHDI